MKAKFIVSRMTRYCLLAFSAGLSLVSGAVVIPDAPLVTNVNVPPVVMLVTGKDHKMFYEAYNDASDIDGDGKLDLHFKPTIKYYGLFDIGLCYTHNGDSDNTGLFEPDSLVDTAGKCPGKWSGNWLNYMTTSRIDALRKVLYGGYREVDSATETILRRAYIPHDAHSWGKEYTSEAVDGYKISDYTPLSQPNANTRHFFGSLTANKSQSCATLNDCSDMPPLLRYRRNVGDGARIWEWASKERPVLHDKLSTGDFPDGTSTEKNRTVRVRVCTATFHSDCKLYPNGQYKPVGLLHDYGESDAMLFGLISGSYDKHMSGGRLRKVVSSFKDEVDADTGQFKAGGSIVSTFDKLRIRGFNQSSTTSEYWKKDPYTDSAKAPTEGQLVDWGNPIGEMMFEATRYFAGKKSATADFAGSPTTDFTKDTDVGLSSATWDDPYAADSAAKAPRCSRASMLTISDVYPSFDSDQVPGSYFKKADDTYFTSDMGTSFVVEDEGDTIAANDASSLKGIKFIGQSKDVADFAPTAKIVESIGSIRGLAPGEPGKQGSYSSAAVAYYAKRSDIRSDLTGKQGVDTFVVALTSPLPEIKVPALGGKFITLVPFAKTVGGSGVSATKNLYQPTNQIVDFYVETLVNATPNEDTTINGGRYQATFLINYEDVEQGGDHDMDAIARYEIKANAGGSVSVTVTPTYQAGGMKQNMGYAISGTTADGVYLVAQDEDYTQNYFLNVPSGQVASYCDIAIPPTGCDKLPRIGSVIPTFTFTPGTAVAAALLTDPLRVAAKWGGFKDKNSNDKPDSASEWDKDGDELPDNYFLVQNPYKLKESLKKAFEAVLATDSSASNVIANSTSVNSNSRVFQARFSSADWSGDLIAFPFNMTTGVISTTEEWNAKLKMFAAADRKLYINGTTGLVEFKYSTLNSTDKATLLSEDVVNYLRGDRTKELTDSGTGVFRKRNADTVLGDIVHSSPFYESISNVIYVGANDGMLHAFKGSDSGIAGAAGTEVFGFIPREAMSKLKTLSDPGYEHTYFVDGDIVVSAATADNDNKNILAASLGRGGRGLFALDVTHPGAFDETKFLWEYTPAASTAAAADNDLGYILGRPAYIRLNNSKNAIIFGNGYNSPGKKAVLYIIELTSSGGMDTVRKIDTGVGTDNGLSSPTGYDSDGNGTIDIIYAGDLEGHVWKFDVSSASPSLWGNALGTTNAFFSAVDTGGLAQPITSPITVGLNNVPGDTHENKLYVFLGTGSYFKSLDPSDTQTQTWYGLIDEGAAITSRSELTLRAVALVDEFAGKPVRTFSQATVGDMVGKKGWYLDFTTHYKERIVTESLLLNLAKPALIVSTVIPDSSDPCIPGGTGFLNVIDPFTGGSTTVGIFDVDNDKDYTNDVLGSSLIGSVDLGVGLPSRPTLIGDRLVVGGTSSEKDKRVSDIGVNLGNTSGSTTVRGRMSWREIILD